MSEIKVGLLALAAMAAVAYMSLRVTSNQSGFGEYVTYRAIVRDASGIFPKTPIKIAGISAGRIIEIELSDNNALITFEVLKRATISKDSMLRIRTVGFLGDKYLEIYLGDSNQRLKELSFISVEEGGGMEGLVRDATGALKDVKIITESIKNILVPGKGQKPLLKKILDDVETLVANTKDATLALKEILNGNQGKLNNLIANMEKMSKNLVYQTSVENDDSAVKEVKNILSNVKKMTEDLKELVADIKSGKGTVGKLLVEEEIVDEVQQTLAGVKKLVGKVDQIRTELDVYTGANTEKGASSALSLRLFPAPERFYLLGLVTSEFGPEKEKHSSRTINGVTTSEVYREREKGSYQFNVQLGRRLQNWTFRGGLLNSSGGIGVDYELLGWDSKFSLDVFDYRKNIGPNLRLASVFQLYRVFRGKVEFEDLIEDSRSATFSVGLKFTDEDLKGLLGFFL